jgi:protoheme IX farnesyltransferase
VSDYWTLARPRIIALVLLSMAVAAWTAGGQPPSWPLLAHSLIGTALVIAGAVALNERMELRGDARMARTAARPLPSGRLNLRQVTRFGLAASAIGLLYLAALTANSRLIALTALSWIIYLGTYTPLKSRTPWQTPIGAVAGAMPTLLGAAAADAGFSLMALTLFAIVYCWQFPHSMAIAWLYRRDFATAEVKVATVVDPTGRTAGVMAALGAAVLVPVSLVPAMFSWAGWGYAVCATLLGAGYLLFALRFLYRAENGTARGLLRASLVYLPALLAALMASALRS